MNRCNKNEREWFRLSNTANEWTTRMCGNKSQRKNKISGGKSFLKCDCEVSETDTTMFLDIFVDKLMRERKLIRRLSYFLLKCMDELLIVLHE
jgi:hypothetical protein